MNHQISTLTVGFITARLHPKARWMFDSLRNQNEHIDEIICVDLFADLEGRRERWREFAGRDIVHVPPHPNVWNGQHRLTKENWWAASTYRNTVLCLCKSEWVLFLDDRCVLQPGFIKTVHLAMKMGVGVCGAYEKRHNMSVLNGEITDLGTLDGSDPRSPNGKDHRELSVPSVPVHAPGSWWFGCCNAHPLDWGLQANGYLELLDGTSHEDSVFGTHLVNNGFPLTYNPNMKVIQDRTPSELGSPMHRTSKERFPHDTEDRCHTALKRFLDLKAAPNNFNIREVRDKVQRGEPFPMPSEADHYDWYDGQPVKDFEWPYVVRKK